MSARVFWIVGSLAAATMWVLPSPAEAASAGQPRCHGRVATIVGTPDGDYLTGTSGDDVIVGRGGGDTIDGKGGNDFICGNTGADLLRGGDGADNVHGKRGNDSLSGGSGNDILSGGLGTATIFGDDAGNDQWYSRTATDTLHYDDAVTLELQAGTATGMGFDALHLGDGIATVFLFNTGGSIVFGSDHRDIVIGYGGNDTVDARGGDDTVALGGQGGVAHGGAGNDDLQAIGPESEVTLDGGDGNDLFASQGGTTVSGGPGNDTVTQLLGCSQCGTGSVYEFSSTHALDAGAGNDLLIVKDLENPFYDAITFDMGAGTLDADGTLASVTGFENLSTFYPSSTTYDVTGTDGPNTMTWFESQAPVVVHGLGGDDTMNGGSADDTFDGGPGDDTADGKGGTDTCTSIEHATSCEG